MFSATKIGSRIISIVLAIIFIAVGLVFFFKYDPDAYDMEATGTIVEIDEHYEYINDENELVYDVYIDYTADGKEYKHVHFPEFNSRMKVGNTVNFFYMSKDPLNIVGTDKNSAPYIGLVFALIGAAMIAVNVIGMIRGR